MTELRPLSDKQLDALRAPLDAARVLTRSQSGRNLSYIEGWWAISEANRIFGFDGWTRETVDVRCVSERQCAIGQRQVPGWSVTYIAKVIVRAGGVVREGCGAGHGIAQDLGGCHESALKEAETDAMKRALMTFGNPFGLALYDKTHANVAVAPEAPQRKSAAQAKRDGDADTVKRMLTDAATAEDLDARWKVVQEEWLPILPEKWEDPMHDFYLNARDALKAKGA